MSMYSASTPNVTLRPNGVESQLIPVGARVTKAGSGRGAADAAAKPMLAISAHARVNGKEFRRMTSSPGVMPSRSGHGFVGASAYHRSIVQQVQIFTAQAAVAAPARGYRAA